MTEGSKPRVNWRMSNLETLASELQRLGEAERDNLPRLGPRHHPWGHRDWKRLGRSEAFAEAAALVRKFAGIETPGNG